MAKISITHVASSPAVAWASPLTTYGPLKFMSFPGGERHVQLPDLSQYTEGSWEVYASIYTPQDIMDLLLTVDALKRMVLSAPIRLVLPYIPYARQDRVANVGEPLSVKVFCSLINAMEFSCVTVLDPHSDVASALIDRVRVVHPHEFLPQELDWRAEFRHGLALVAPDAGARKKVEALAKAMHVPIVFGTKKRDTATGALSGFGVEGDVPSDRPLLVVDDICDGGGTFIGLVKVLREKTTQPIYLYVSHGLFTRGVQCLLDAGYQSVFCSNLKDRESPEATLVHTIGWL